MVYGKTAFLKVWRYPPATTLACSRARILLQQPHAHTSPFHRAVLDATKKVFHSLELQSANFLMALVLVLKLLLIAQLVCLEKKAVQV